MSIDVGERLQSVCTEQGRSLRSAKCALLSDVVPNEKKLSLGVFAKLVGAWVTTGLRIPKMPITGEINV